MTALAALATLTVLAAVACILPGRQRPPERQPATRPRLAGIYPSTLAAWRTWPIESGPRICARRYCRTTQYATLPPGPPPPPPGTLAAYLWPA